jgi:hypothetical protein
MHRRFRIPSAGGWGIRRLHDVRTPGVSNRVLYFYEYCKKIQMLPPIEFFMGMIAGGLLGYFVAIMVSSSREERHR